MKPSKLSDAQLYALYVGKQFTLRRSSMGWWADGHPNNIPVVRIMSPATIKSLWRMGLLDATPNLATLESEAHTSTQGVELLNQISQDTGISYDLSNDTIVYPDNEMPQPQTFH
jgi:hypothetical protein